MSIQAINWALEQPGTPTQKHVLLVLANYANESGHAFPSNVLLATKTGLTDRAVRNAKKALLETGLLEKSGAYGRGSVRLCLEMTVAAKTEPRSTKAEPRSDKQEPRSACSKPEPRSAQPEYKDHKKERGSGPYNHHITTTNHTPSVSPSTAPHLKRGSRLPDDWQPTEQLVAYATERGLSPERQAEDFRDYWHSATGKNAIKCDWSAAFRTWCRKAVDFQQSRQRKNGTCETRSSQRSSNPFAGFGDDFDEVIPELTPEQKSAYYRYGGHA